MSVNGNGEKRRTVNALDVLLIILIIGAIAVVVATIVRANPNIVSGGDKDIEYVIRAEGIPAALKDKLSKGAFIYDDDSGQLLGEVTDVSYEQSVLVGYNGQGEAVYTSVDGKIDLTVTVRVSVWADGSSMKIDSYRIAVGATVSFHSESIAVTGRCISITEIRH